MAIDTSKFRQPNRVRLGIIESQFAVCLHKDVVDELGFALRDDDLDATQYVHFTLAVDPEFRHILIYREVKERPNMEWLHHNDELPEHPGLYQSHEKIENDSDGEIAQVLLWRDIPLTGLRRDDVVPSGVENYEIVGGQIMIALPNWIFDPNWQPAKPLPKRESQSASA